MRIRVTLAHLFVLLCFGVVVLHADGEGGDGVVRAVLFSSPTCPHCRTVREQVLPPLTARFGARLQIVTISTTTPSGVRLYFAAVERFGIVRRGVPMLVVGDLVLIGSDEIPARFPAAIERHLAEGGLSWPDIPGLAAVLPVADPTPVPAAPSLPDAMSADLAPLAIPPPADTLTEAATPAPGPVAMRQPTIVAQAEPTEPRSHTPPRPMPVPQGEPALAATSQEAAASATPEPLGLPELGHEAPGVFDRVAADPHGNGMAIAVLIGMIATVVWSTPHLLRSPVARHTDRLEWLSPILSIAGLGVAAYLAQVEVRDVQAVCGPVGDCNTVQQSEYARLFGLIPIGVLGVAGFAAILATWLVRRLAPRPLSTWAAAAALGMTGSGTLFSIYLTFLEPFVIGATCMWCLSSAVLITVLYWLALHPGHRAAVALLAEHGRAWLSIVLLLAVAASAHAETRLSTAEPAFCSPDAFLSHEITEEGADGVKRLHAYRLGAVVLAGMAIGYSEADAVARLAAAHGSTSEDRFCTWYVNRGNAEAGRLFRQVYLPSPVFLSPGETADIYGNRLGPSFAEERGSIWWCLEERGFVAVGCNGQRHRGPTAFGMVLAALGCSPAHAAEIVNRIWGLNEVPAASRLAAMRRAYDLGTLRPALRSRLQQRLSGPPSSALQPVIAPEAKD